MLRKLRKKRILLLIVVSTSFWIVLQSGHIEFTKEKEVKNMHTKWSKSLHRENLNKNNNNTERTMKTAHQAPLPSNNKQIMVNTTIQIQGLISLEVSQPVQLALRVQGKCKNYLKILPRRPEIFPISTNNNYKLLFCPMCKLASTYWTKFFKMLEVYNINTSINSPYDIPLSKAKPTRERLKISQGVSGTKYDSYYKFMFVRDPYARILSAYVDKLFAPNPTFWRSVCKKVISTIRDHRKPHSKCGSDLTFEEYIQAIIHAHKKTDESGMTDCHDASFIGSCHPCELKMDFIGKMEQFSSDSNFLYHKLNLDRTIETLYRSGEQLADEDALYDTVTSPFKWKNDIKTCVPWHNALKRIWRKLQIRGVIGKEQLPLTEDQAENISEQEFLDLIKKTHNNTAYSVRKKQRSEALIEIYSQVNIDYLHQLKYSYRNDFEFFEYDSNPTYIFNVSRKDIEHYGYLEL